MARYNTAPQTLTLSGTTTLTYAFTGGIISLTGTAGYTVTIASPVFFPGSRQTFYNATSGSVTLTTVAGNIVGNGVTIGASVVIPTNSTYVLTSNGANYVLTSALAGTTVFELPVTTKSTFTAEGAVSITPANNNVTISPTGSGTVAISPAGLLSIQPGGNVTISPTGASTLTLDTAGGALTIGSASVPAVIGGNLSVTGSGRAVTLSPAGAGTVSISPGGNTTIGSGGTLAISSTTAGTINNMSIGSVTRGTGSFTTLTANNAVTFTANTASSGTSNGTVVVTGGVGVSGNIYAGALQGTPIGSSTRSTGAFTTLTSNAATTFTAGTAATTSTSGTLVVTGGVGVSGDIYAGSIQNTAIGSSTRSSGAFTTLTSNGATTFTAGTASTTTTSGTLIVTGGVGVSGQITAATLSGNVVGGTGSFTTLTASSTITLSPANATVAISPTGTGTVTINPAGALTVNPSTAGTINNMSIGASTRSTGAFTSLTSNGATTFTAGTASSGTTSGTLVVTGGVGISGNTYVGGAIVGSNSVQIGANGASNDAYGSIAVTEPANATNYSYYGLTRAGQIGAGFGLTGTNAALGLGANAFWFGSATSGTAGAMSAGWIAFNGSSFVTAGTITEQSSLRFKENIKPIDGALDKILQLQGVTYDKKDGSAFNEAGLIAEDVLNVIPNLVQMDEESGLANGIHYTKLTAYLIEAVKSLKQEIDQLKGNK